MRRPAPALLLSWTLALTAGAAADQPKAPLPPDVVAAARAAFAEAQAADDKGDLATAIERYRYAQRIAPHPSVTYNLADVLRRKHDVRGAITEYRAYLRDAPDAPDRAKVEAVLAKLEAIRGDVDVTSDAADAIVFIDGVRQAAAVPIFLEMAPGAHRFDALTALSFRSDVEVVEPTGKHYARLDLPDRVDGNLVVSGSGALDRARVTVDGARDTHHVGDRLLLPAGKHAIAIDVDDCTWRKTVTVPAAGVLYLYLTATPPPKPPRGAKPTQPPPKPVCGKGTWASKKLSFAAPSTGKTSTR